MAGVTFKKRDRNLFKRVYPYIRREPRMELVSSKGAYIEVAAITFTNVSIGNHTFSQPFEGVPIVTVTSVDSLSNGIANVNAFITTITTTTVTVQTSQAFSGEVHLHAIWVEV